MSFKKITSLILVIVMMFTISACSSKTKEEPMVTDTTTETATTTEPAATTEPEPEKIVDIVINTNGADNVGGSGDVDDQIKVLQDTVDKDTKDNKPVATTITSLIELATTYNKILTDQGYNLIQEDWGWSDPLVQKQTAAFIAKQTPDVITGETQSPGFAAQGLLEPFPAELEAKVRKEVIKGAWSPMEYNGKIYGVAFQPGVSVLYWNKDLFRKAGLDPEVGPKTWDDVLVMSKKINEAGKGEYWGNLMYAGPNNGGYLRAAGIFPLINGGGFVDDTNQPIFNNEKNIAAFQFLRDLNQYAPLGAMANASEGAYWDPITKGLIGIWAEGPWMLSMCKDLKIEYGIGSLPISEGGAEANITIGAAFASVPVYAKNKAGGFKFIEAMLSDEVQGLVAKQGVRPPVLISIGESEEYKTNNPEMYIYYKALAGNVKGLPTFAKDNSKAWDVYGEAMVKSLMTEEDIKSILDEAQKKVEIVIK